MSILDDLSSAIRNVHESAGPAVVGIGQGNRGRGVLIAAGRVLTNVRALRAGRSFTLLGPPAAPSAGEPTRGRPAGGSAGHGPASPSGRRSWPGGWGAPWASPGGRACWSGAWKPAAPPTGPGSVRAT